MDAQLIPVGLILLSALYAGVGLLVNGQRPSPVSKSFTWGMFSIAVWSLGYGLEFLSPTLSGKLMWAKMEILGVASLPVFLFCFSAAYTGRSSLLNTRKLLLVCAIPALTLLAAWTPRFDSLIWQTVALESKGLLTFMTVNYGYLAWLQIACSYLLIGLASAFLVLESVHSPRPFNVQASVLLLGILFPGVGSLLSLSGIVLPGIDMTPFLFLPTVAILAWGIIHYRLLGILPVAPAIVLRELQDGVAVIDARRNVLYLNNMAERLLQTTAEAAIGQPIESIRASDQESLNQLLDQVIPFLEMEFEINGEKRFFDVRISDLSKKEGVGNTDASHLITIRDIHERKQVELNLQRREAMMAALNRAAQQFLRRPAWEANIPAFLETIGQAAGVGRTYVFQNYDGQDGQAYTSQCYEWAGPGVAPQINNPAFRQIPLRCIGPASWYEELSQERLVTAHISELDQADLALFIERGVCSTVIVPIFVERRWWGSLGLEDFSAERKWSKAKLDALQAAAEIFSASETRARNENTLYRRQRTLNLLHEIVASALQTNDRHSMAQTIVNYLGNLFNSDGCFLSLWEADCDRFTPLAAYGLFSKEFMSLAPEPGEPTLTSSALATGHTLLVEDLSSTPYISPRIAARLPYRSAMALPLLAGQKKLGAILLAYSGPHAFQPEETAIGEQAAGLAALTLEKFSAIDEARQRAQEAEILRKAGAAVASTLHSEEAINRILEQLSLVIPYDSASVQLLRKGELEIVGGRGWANPEKVLGLRFPVPADNPNSVVIETGKPYFLGDVYSHPSFRDNGPPENIRSWLGAPLIVHGKIIGLLTVDSGQPNYFTTTHIKTVATFADQVAIALENARLFEEVQNMALTDSLTGLYNRRGLSEISSIEFARTHRLKRPFSLIMVDIDHFKEINDRYGHPAGDQVLQLIAAELTGAVRDSDIVGRYGGEEFAIFLSDSDGTAAMELAQRLRETIERMSFFAGGSEIRITISVGVAEYNENSPNLQTLIARADQALYVAKHKGRNQVVLGT